MRYFLVLPAVAGNIHQTHASSSSGTFLLAALISAVIMLQVTVGLLLVARRYRRDLGLTPAAEPAEPAMPTEPAEPTEPAKPAEPAAQEKELPSERHQVTFGDDLIEVVLAEAPAAGLAWTQLPYDTPGEGLAYACVGAGDEGCLLVDLAAAPGAVALTGDTDTAIRLAESMVYQLCGRLTSDQSISVLLVGSAIPEPHPAAATSVEALRDLATAGLDHPPHDLDIVFCELHSDDDALELASYAGSSACRVVPVVLGPAPDAAWTFHAGAGEA
jgi:hypothetical protein